MNKLSFLLFGVLFATQACSQTSPKKNPQPPTPQIENRPLDQPKPEMTAMDYMEKSNTALQDGDYNSAISLDKKAFELERKERKLPKPMWFILIDTLAMAYAGNHEIKRSQDVVDYGIKQEPTYPIFYYIKACAYGQTDDEVGAIKYLRLAFKYKDNIIEGETFPDPSIESSFERLMKRKTFLKAVAEMKGSH